ncbi:hypothetical protein ACQQR6_002205 [Providencia stuartii]
MSVTPLHKKIYRGVIVTGVVACALVAGIPLFIHSNVISSHSEALSQLGQRLQAIEMKMADSVTDDRMNAQLDVLRQGPDDAKTGCGITARHPQNGDSTAGGGRQTG